MEKKHKLFKPALSLFGCHIAGVIIAFIFVVGFAALNDSFLGQLITVIVVLIVYSIPSYCSMWLLGNQDINLIRCNKKERDILRGFKIGFVSSIPSFCLAIYFFSTKIFPTSNIVFLYRVLNSEISPIIQMINNNSSLMKISIGEMAVFSLLTAIPAIFAGVFYIMGLNNITPVRRLIYKKSDK